MRADGEKVPPEPVHLYTPQPFSNRAIHRLGEALAAERRLTESETQLWRSFSIDALDRTSVVTEFVTASLELEWFARLLPRVAASRVTGRPKTRKTLVEKLRRSPQIGLPRVHDVAGVRVVGSFTLIEQEQAAFYLARTFDGIIATDRPTLTRSRLDDPNFGYRALHLIVYPEGRPVEIQLRTDLQHAWAELMEVMTDRWGREPRYGDPVNHPDDQERHRRQTIIDQFVALSATIADFESAASASAVAHVHLRTEDLEAAGLSEQRLAEMGATAAQIEPQLESVKHAMLRAIAQFEVDANLEGDL